MTLSFSFSAGGWTGGSYHLGVVKALKERLFLDEAIVFGCSAGSWATLALLTDKNKSIDDIHQDYCNNLNQFNILPLFAEKKLRKMLQDMKIKYQDTDNDTLNRICLSVSRFNFPNFYPINEVRTSFSNWLELENSVIESSLIPFIVGLRLNVLDGWISKSINKLDENTIVINFVSPFGDITPSEIINPLYIFLRPSKSLSKYVFDLGYKDAVNYLDKINILSNNMIEKHS